MKKKTHQAAIAQEEMLIDFTVHDLPVDLVREFAVTVVRPYYFGNLKTAIKDLLEKAIADQEFVQNRMVAHKTNRLTYKEEDLPD